jgi:phosphatidate cytidylyltransferase
MLKRIITGSILGGIAVLAVLFLSILQFAMLSAGVLLIAAWEFSQLAGWRNRVARFGFVLILLFLVGMLGYFLMQSAQPDMPIFQRFWLVFPSIMFNHPIYLLLAVVFWGGAIFFILTYPRSAVIWNRYLLLKSAIGYWVLISGWLSLLTLAVTGGRWVLLLMFVGIWSSDTVAHSAGLKWGARGTLLLHVSPKKSRFGFFAGLLSAMVVTLIMGGILDRTGHLFWMLSTHSFDVSFLIVLIKLLALGALVGFFSAVGDLFESMLKRNVGIKDTGHYLPGHGGILDRIDSILAVAPVYLLVYILWFAVR